MLPAVFALAQTVSRASILPFPTALLLHATPYIAYTVLYCYLNVHYPSTYGTDLSPQVTGTYIALLVLLMLMHVAFIALGAWARGRLRKAYGISGAVHEDIGWQCCCTCCAIAQEARHVDRDYGLQV